MPTADIRIVRHGDEPPLAKMAEGREVVHLSTRPWTVCILEGGMGSGAPSIGLALELPDGTLLIAETSLAIWSSVTVAARGAFPEAFVGGPLEVRE